MIRNYLLVALRSLSRQRIYSAINVTGLAVGVACFVLIALYVDFERGFDRFHDRSDRIHRVVHRQPGNIFLGSDHFAVTPAPLASSMVEAIPEVIDATALTARGRLLQVGDESFYETGLEADDRFFHVFSFRILAGASDGDLTDPSSIVLTEDLAVKMFETTDVVGRTVDVGTNEMRTVTAVVENVPAQSHLTFSFVTSLRANTHYVENRATWDQNSWFTYAVLRPGVDAGEVDAKIQSMVRQHRDASASFEFYTQPLETIHLHSRINFEISPNGDVRYVYLFGAVAIIILLLACINYTNLAIARSLKRLREVGMRKAIGAHRRQIAAQFLGESLVLAALAVLGSLILLHVAAPYFGRLIDRPIVLDFGLPWLPPLLIALILVVGFLAGAYPALLMASMRPVDVLKSASSSAGGKTLLQRVLITVQYACSIALVAGSLVIFQQLRYVQSTDPGYDREHVVSIPMQEQSVRDRYEALRSELLSHPGILAVTTVGHLPTNITSSSTRQHWEGSNDDTALPIYQTEIGVDILDVFGIELLEGRAPTPGMSSDTVYATLINQTAKKALGWDDAIGKRIGRHERVVGVVKDFHLHSLHEPIQPLMLRLTPGASRFIAMRIANGDEAATLAHARGVYERFSRFPFEYAFLDDTYASLYDDEQRLGDLLGHLTILALLIASLGLFGLAAYAAERRTKEIGVRKVLGATVSQIVVMLGREFTVLVAIGALIALPAAYLAADRWLANFAYRIDVGIGVLAASVAASLLAAWLSVSYQSVKAARLDPARSLRNE